MRKADTEFMRFKRAMKKAEAQRRKDAAELKRSHKAPGRARG